MVSFFPLPPGPLGMVDLSRTQNLNLVHWVVDIDYKNGTIKGFSHVHGWQIFSGLSVLPVAITSEKQDNDLYKDFLFPNLFTMREKVYPGYSLCGTRAPRHKSGAPSTKGVGFPQITLFRKIAVRPYFF